MVLQALVVAPIVVACATYAAWTLMPASARRALALALLKLPLPGPLAAAMTRHSVVSSGCACDGCDKATAKVPATGTVPGGVAPIVFHPRLRK